MTISELKFCANLNFFRRFRFEIDVAAKTEAVARIGRPEGCTQPRTKRQSVPKINRIFGIPGDLVAKGLVICETCSEKPAMLTVVDTVLQEKRPDRGILIEALAERQCSRIFFDEIESCSEPVALEVEGVLPV